MLRQFFVTCPIIKNLFIPFVFLYIECYFDIQKHFSLYYVVFMIRFVELLPINMIAYRAQYGSPNPAAIVGPAIFATGMSTLAAVIFCRIMNGKK